MNEKIVRYKGTTVVTYSSYLSKNQRRENAIFKNILMVLKKSIVKIHKINYVLLCPGFQTG